jgi:hypothetical protein
MLSRSAVQSSLGLGGLMTAVLLCCSPSLGAESGRLQYSTPDITFEAPTGFSKLQSGGSQTAKIVYNQAIDNQVRKAEVRFIVVDTQTIGLEGPEWPNYVRFRHFGINGQPAQRKTRLFMGQTVVGDVFYMPSPEGTAYLEFYLVPLENNRQLAIAFQTDLNLPLQVFEETVKSISTSLKEVPQKKKKRKKAFPF